MIVRTPSKLATLLAALAAGCGGSSGDGPPALLYVEGGQPRAGAPVVISTLDGETLLETETDHAGAVPLDLAEPALVTVGRTPVPTQFNLRPFASEADPEVFSRVVEPGQRVTVGSTVPAFDAAPAGRLVVQFAGDAPEADFYYLALPGVLDYFDPHSVSEIPVPAAAVDEGTYTVLAWALDFDLQLLVYSYLEVDLAPLRAGQTELTVDMPAWQTDVDELQVSLTGLADAFVGADLDLWRGGKRYPYGSHYGHTPGSALPETVELAIRLPRGFADHIETTGFNSSDLTPHWLTVTEHLSPGATSTDLDIGASAPPGCYGIDVQLTDATLVRVSWDGGGGSEDAIDLSLRNVESAVPWHLLLPPDTPEIVLPTLPPALAGSQINPSASLEAFVHHTDLPTADGYDSYLDAFTARGLLTSEPGDLLFDGACGGQLF